MSQATTYSFPASFAQQRIWFIHQVDPENPMYNLPLRVTLRGILDVDSLQTSLQHIVDRHEALRTTFADKSGELQQIVTADIRHELNQFDFSHLSINQSQAETDRVVHAEAQDRFDLQKGPLVRFTLIRRGSEDHDLILNFHHAILDGWSVGILFRELQQLYAANTAGKVADLPQPTLQYADYAIWQREALSGGDLLERALDFWEQQLRDVSFVLELPTDRPRPAIQQFRGSRVSFQLSATIKRKLQDYCSQAGVTLYAAVLSAFSGLLHRYCQQNSFVILSPIAGRERHELSNIVGCFVNTLALPFRFGEQLTWNKLIKTTHDMALDGFAHQVLPFEKLVEKLQPARDLSHAPLGQVMFVFHNEQQDLDLSGLQATRSDVDNGTAKLDLSFSVTEAPDGFLAQWEFNTDLFDEGTVERMHKHWVQILKTISNKSDCLIETTPILTSNEEQQLLSHWNQTQVDIPNELGIHHLFEAQAESTPSSVAIEFEGQWYTYSELDQRSNQLAHHLRSLGIVPNELVGICVERCLDMVVGVLGILKAGGAYVPLDPAYPADRLDFMMSDSGLDVLVTQLPISKLLPKHGAKTVLVDTDWQDISTCSTKALDDPIESKQLAYVIYTSGSTGKPKGVDLLHDGVVNFLKSMANEPGLSERDILVAVTTLSFDISVLELFLPLVTGARVVIASREVAANGQRLLDLVESSGATVLQATPATWHLLIASGWSGSSRLKALCGGETLSAELADHLVQRAASVWNMYGPTETTIWSTIRHIKKQGETISIGRPIANTRIYILDEQLLPVPVGIPGELYIAGSGLARGYRNRPELTQERFVSDPFDRDPNARMYRTGDLARYRPDGHIECLGRLDSQVKLRGFRIELEEIETVLVRIPGVRQATVALREDVAGDQRLVGYVVLTDSSPLSVDQLYQPLRDSLPEYMVPSAIVKLDNFPLTHNGKVNRQALPEPSGQRTELGQQLIIPRSKAESIIASVWKESLRVDAIGIDENFFDLGGHSLLLVGVHEKLKPHFSDDLSIHELFQYPTVRTLAARLTQQTNEEVSKDSQPPREAQSSGPWQIAIVGMACRFPGASTVERFWNNLENGTESIAFFEDSELTSRDLSSDLLNNPKFVKAFGAIDDIDKFSPEFFSYSDREAALIDPQQRLFLESAWEVLEQAGYAPDSMDDSVGVFAGTGFNQYAWDNLQHYRGQSGSDKYLMMIGNDKDFLPTRVAYKLNFKGPAVNVQTACSTSLVAVYMACQALRRGECDVALAGGASVAPEQKMGYLHEEGMILSADGHCRAFDAQATGTVPASGVGVVVLKPLDCALADGDHVYAVIRGGAINNDGATKVGYTAPGVDGQMLVIQRAQAAAGVTGDDISYVEAHGTGTKLGDPIEIAALSNAFRKTTSRKQFCAVGSVKTNIGHVDAAAGVAGLMKTALSLCHRKLPPSLHFEQPNPEIDFVNSPFFVNAKLRDWNQQQSPIAGVSSFGIGGTNCHLILEASPTSPPRDGHPSDIGEVLVVSGKSEKALQQQAEHYVRYLDAHPDTDIADLCFTASAGRSHFDHRLGVTATSIGDIRQTLAKFANSTDEDDFTRGLRMEGHPKVAWLFSGQGSQSPGMGKELYEHQRTFRRAVDECSELFNETLDRPLLDVMFGNNAELLEQTAYTQTALFTLEYSLAKLWQSWGLAPDLMIGHSIGELVAACVAGVFNLRDGTRLVAARANLMHELPANGTMCAILASEDHVDKAIAPYADEVSIASINGPELTVISGVRERIEKLSHSFNEQNIKTRFLKVSHAFHSPLMEPMLDAFADVARTIAFQSPAVDFVSNVTGKVTTDQLMDPSYWVRHVRQPVRFHQGMSTVHNEGCSVFLEIGPDATLTSMAAATADDRCQWRQSLRGGHDDRVQILETLKQLYVSGVDIDWNRFYHGRQHRRIALPSYPFERKRCWVDRVEKSLRPTTGQGTTHPLLGQRRHVAPLVKREIIYESQFSAEESSFFGEHRFMGQPTFPAVTFLELAVAAGRKTLPGLPFEIQEFATHFPLVLHKANRLLVQCVVTPTESNQYNFATYSMKLDDDESQKEWLHHASAVIQPCGEQNPITKRTSQNGHIGKPVNCEKGYEDLQHGGLWLGPTLRTLVSLSRTPETISGQARLTESTSSDAESYDVHPLLLNACVQAVAMSRAEDISPTFTQLRVKRLVFFGPLGKALRFHAEINTGSNAGDIQFDCDVFGEDEQLAVQCEGMEPFADDQAAVLPTACSDILDWRYEIKWQSADNVNSQPIEPCTWLILADGQGVGHSLADQLCKKQQTCLLVTNGDDFKQTADDQFTIRLTEQKDFQRIFEIATDADRPRLRGVINLWVLDAKLDGEFDGTELVATQRASCESSRRIVQALFEHPWQAPPRLWLVSQGAVNTGNDPPISLLQAPLWGLGKSIGWEHPEFRPSLVDLGPVAVEEDVLMLADAVLRDDDETQVSYRFGQRLVARLAKSPVNTNQVQQHIHDDATYLVTGGLGGLGLEAAKWLAQRGATHITLMGRREPSSESKSLIRTIQDQGAHINTVQADVSDLTQLRKVIEEISESGPAIRGILHLAGTLDDGILMQLDWSRFQTVMAPKIAGTWNLHLATQHLPLKFFVCFSSVSSLLGSQGQANYAAANAFMDGFGHYRQQNGLPGLSISWGAWADVGMAARLGDLERQKIAKIAWSIPPAAGMSLISLLIGSNKPHFGVLGIDWDRFFTNNVNTPPYFNTLCKLASASKNNLSTDASDDSSNFADTADNSIVFGLTKIWKQVLGQKTIGLTDDFFSLGGHSLLALRMFSQIEKTYGRKFTLATLFEAPTIEQLARLLQTEPEVKRGSLLVPIKPNGIRSPLFCIHPIGANVMHYADLARQMPENQPVYGIEPQGLDGNEPCLDRVEDMAHRYIESMRSLQPEGPYYLCGSSFGGDVAYEIAQQLTKQGVRIALLGLIDVWAPGYCVYPTGTPRWRIQLNNLVNRVVNHSINFRGRNGREKWGYLRETVSNAIQKGKDRLVGNTAVSENIQQVRKANQVAIDRYVHKPYGGEIVLFRAQKQPYGVLEKRDLGWSSWVLGDMQIHNIDGYHGECCREPHVHTLAKSLNACLEDLHSRAVVVEPDMVKVSTHFSG